MKTAELFEYKYRRKSEEEKDALRNAPDYWRLQLRKELNKLNQQFGITVRKPYTFSRHDTHIADIGGEYNVLVSGDNSLSFPKEKRLEMWKKVYAQKIHQLVKDGYEVYIDFRFRGAEIKPEETAQDILARMELQMKSWRNVSERHPIMGSFRIIVKKPNENRPTA
jgi:hypothetical protein